MKAVMYVTALILMLLYPDISIQSAREALRLWSTDVIPSLFPYMVLCRLISGHLRRHHISAGIAAVFLGFIGGSPSGSAVLSGYSPEIPRRNLLSLCAITGTLSPMFLLGTAGAWMPEGFTGWMLLVSHTGGALLTAALILIIKDKKRVVFHRTQEKQQVHMEADPIEQSISSVFHVGGCIVFYSVLASLICSFPGMNEFSSSIIHAIMEVSGGMYAVSRLPLSPAVSAVLLSAASGFSGLSILSQNLVFLSPLGIKIADLLFIGMIRAFLSACIMLLECMLAI